MRLHWQMSKFNFLSSLPLSKAFTHYEFFETCQPGLKLVKEPASIHNDVHHWKDKDRDHLGVAPQYHTDDNSDYNALTPSDLRNKNIKVSDFNNSFESNPFKIFGSVCVPCGVGSYKRTWRAGPCHPCPPDTFQQARGAVVSIFALFY